MLKKPQGPVCSYQGEARSSDIDWDSLYAEVCREQAWKVLPKPQMGECCWRSVLKTSSNSWSSMWGFLFVWLFLIWSDFLFCFSQRTRLTSAPSQIHLKFLYFSSFRLLPASPIHAAVSAVVKFRWLFWILQHSSGLETSGFSSQFQTWHSPIPS